MPSQPSSCLREINVTGFSQSNDKVWYYNIDIQDNNSRRYTIRRRFSDFNNLYNVLTSKGTKIPISFPSKFQSFYQQILVQTCTDILSDRKQKFQKLICWIENNSKLRNTDVFIKFIGRPPITNTGYVSLKSYNGVPKNWLANFHEQLEKQRHCRTRKRRQTDAVAYTALSSSEEDVFRPRKGSLKSMAVMNNTTKSFTNNNNNRYVKLTTSKAAAACV